MQTVPVIRWKWRAATFTAAWAVLGIACAVSEPPSGGPEDKVQPTVASSVPRPDSTGVDVASEIRVEFSEPMRRERVERNVVVNPAIEIERVRWEENTLILRPAGGLVRDTTYVVRIKPDYEDRHGVAGARWHEFAFATGSAALDTARIEGTVRLKRAPANFAIVRCFRVAGGDTLDLAEARPDREVTATRDGEFTLRYLPSNDAHFVVMAFLDENANRVFNPDSDPAAVYADTVVIVSGHPVVDGVAMALLDPKEPGTVKGTVANESGADSARVMVAMYEVADSTRAAYRAVCDSAGAYEVTAVKPGSYLLRAFVDIKTDSLPGLYPCASNPKGCPEPHARRPGVVRMTAAAEIVEPLLVIRRKEDP